MKSFTGREIYEAMEKNGYKWQANGWIYFERSASGSPILKDGKPIILGACILGQAELNLGINIASKARFDALFPAYLIWSFNDQNIGTFHNPRYHTYEEILAFAKEKLTPYWDEVFTFDELDLRDR